MLAVRTKKRETIWKSVAMSVHFVERRHGWSLKVQLQGRNPEDQSIFGTVYVEGCAVMK
jgi:hypothetical protein